MAEALGAISSLLSIIKAVKTGARLINEREKIPEEIKSLQEQVQIFEEVLRNVEAIAQGSGQESFLPPLKKAQIVLQDLDCIIKVKLVQHGGRSNFARYVAWWRNKSKVASHLKSFQDAREALSIALSANTLSNTLIAVGHQVTQQATGSRIDRRLQGIESMLYQPNHTNDDDLLLSPLETVAFSSFALERREFDQTHSVTSAAQHSFAAVEKPDPVAIARQASPASAFELSSHFIPVAYTVKEAVPAILCNEICELQATAHIRVNRCALFFRTQSRKWIRVLVTITISSQSRYWNLWRRKHVHQTVQASSSLTLSLPSRLKLELNALFVKSDLKCEDSQFGVFLGDQTSDKDNVITDLQSETDNTAFKVRPCLQAITNKIRHFNCKPYFHEYLDQQPWNPALAFMFTFSKPDKCWLLDFPFGSSKFQIGTVFYHFFVLQQCMSGPPGSLPTPGIIPLVGVVVDEDTGIITSFLCEFPAKGRLLDVIHSANQSGQPISWERREKWCRQIVEAVATLHYKGLVAGFLGDHIGTGPCVDAQDNAQLTYRFRTRVGTRPDPLPEYRESKVPVGEMTITPEIDIFQLGYFLWRLAANTATMVRAICCKAAGCPRTFDCEEPHSYPTQLPCPNTDCPQYLRNIISACRAEHPEERASAYELLQIFPKNEAGVPTREESAPALPKPSISEQGIPRRPEDFANLFYVSSCCNICGERCSHHTFTCGVCSDADFSMCPACLAKERHCNDLDH